MPSGYDTTRVPSGLNPAFPHSQPAQGLEGTWVSPPSLRYFVPSTPQHPDVGLQAYLSTWLWNKHQALVVPIGPIVPQVCESFIFRNGSRIHLGPEIVGLLAWWGNSTQAGWLAGADWRNLSCFRGCIGTRFMSIPENGVGHTVHRRSLYRRLLAGKVPALVLFRYSAFSTRVFSDLAAEWLGTVSTNFYVQRRGV